VLVAALLCSGPARADGVGDLSDEFENPATLGHWSRLHVTEQWGAEKLEVYDIGANRSGHLVMMPYASTWYADFIAAYAYKQVTGDFVATTRLQANGRDGTIPESDYSLAGILARAPRDITPATWTPGGEDYVFMALGTGTAVGTAYQIEEKTTNDSISDLQLRNVGEDTGYLQIARIGDLFVTLYRMEGGDWTVFRRHLRTDLPATLQVGMHAYTDYSSVGALDPVVQNASVLSGVGNPDLIASFDWVRFAVPQVPGPLQGLDLGDAQAVPDAWLLGFLGANAVPAAVPEPGQWLLLICGLGLMAVRLLRRSQPPH
jgi:hypothetical protein